MNDQKQTQIIIDTQNRRKRYSKETLLTFSEQNGVTMREIMDSIIIDTNEFSYWFNLTKSGNYNIWSALPTQRRKPPKPDPQYFKVRAFLQVNSGYPCADLVEYFDTLTNAITFVDGLCKDTYRIAEVTNERAETLYKL